MLSDNEIIGLIKKPANKEKIHKCIKLEESMKRFMDGLGYTNPIDDDLVGDWQSDAKKDAMKHLDTAPTLPLSKLIRDELNKGIKTDNAVETSKPDNEKIEQIKSSIWKENDISFFIDTFLKKAIDTDFCSFLVVTKGKLIEDEEGNKYEIRDNVIKQNEKDFLPYVIYISISDVHDFKKTGSNVDYLIYKFEEKKEGSQKYKVYRYIDKDRDALFIEKQNEVNLIDDSVFFHKVGYTPVKQISDMYLISSMLPEITASQLSHVVGEFASYEIQFKELKISEVRHAFPKYYSIGFKCPVCDGDKQILNPDTDPEQSALYHFHNHRFDVGETITCPYCKGEGSIATINSKEVMKLPAAINDQPLNLTGAPAGFIQFPRDSLEYQDEKLKDLESKIIFDCTGNKNIVIARLQTATEVDTNTRSLESRIQERQSLIESNIVFSVETACLMAGIKVEYDYKFQRNVSYKSTDTLYKEIAEASKSGMPKEYIDQLRYELTQIRFNQPDIVEIINKSIENETGTETNQGVQDSE